MKNILLIVLGFYIPNLFAETNTMTISNMPIAADEDFPVCYDGSSGKLGNCSPAATGIPKRIAWVSKDGGGDYDDPVAAMDDLDSWCSSPNFINRCLLRIAPGTWVLSAPLFMVAYVDIEGSGKYLTILKSGEDVTSTTTGLINGANSSALRNLRVIAKGTGSYAAAILSNNKLAFNLDSVWVELSGDATWSHALRVANAFGTEGSSRMSVWDSNIFARSSGNNRAVIVVNSTDASMSVSITGTQLLAHNNTSSISDQALQVSTGAGSSANVWINYSNLEQTAYTSGAGSSTISIKHSAMRGASHTATFGWISCQFITAFNVARVDTCPP